MLSIVVPGPVPSLIATMSCCSRVNATRVWSSLAYVALAISLKTYVSPDIIPDCNTNPVMLMDASCIGSVNCIVIVKSFKLNSWNSATAGCTSSLSTLDTLKISPVGPGIGETLFSVKSSIRALVNMIAVLSCVIPIPMDFKRFVVSSAIMTVRTVDSPVLVAVTSPAVSV